MSLAFLPARRPLLERVLGNNCENVVGYVPIPVGTAGPLLVDGQKVYTQALNTVINLCIFAVKSAERGITGGYLWGKYAFLFVKCFEPPFIALRDISARSVLCIYIHTSYVSLSPSLCQ